MGILSDVNDGLSPVNEPQEQASELFWRAQCAFNWSHLDEARSLAHRAFDLIPAQSWRRGEDLPHLHQLLGLLDLRNDDQRGAKEHLAASARVDSESTLLLWPFGPSMVLADALLKVGEREAVLEYLDAWRQLWALGELRVGEWSEERRDAWRQLSVLGESRVREWSEQVLLGQVPDFGPNRHMSAATGPSSWELRGSDTVLGRLYLRTRDRAWFNCTFEPMAGFTGVEKSLQYDFRNLPDDILASLDAFDRLQELGLILLPGNGGSPVTGMVIQVQGDTAYFRY